MESHTLAGFLLIFGAVLVALFLSPLLSSFTGSKGVA